MPVIHQKVSIIPDEPDTALVRPSAWNDGHVVNIDLDTEASGTLQAEQFPALTGDVTTSAGSLITTIIDDVHLTGNPTTTTQLPGNNSTRIATTAYVNAAISVSDVTLAGENYLSLSGQVITANPVDLSTSNITGILPLSHFPTGGAGTILAGKASSGSTYADFINDPVLGVASISNGSLGLANTAGGTLSLLSRNASDFDWLFPISAGSSGQFLISKGTGSAQEWHDLSYSDVTGALGYTPGEGTVISVGINPANGVTVSGSPVTSSGNMIVGLGDITPNSVNGLILSPQTAGFTIQGGNTFSYTITVPNNATVSGTNSGDVTLAGENYLSIAGQVITASAVNLSGSNATGTLAAGRFPALTGDVTTNAGNLSTTLATVNSNVGTFGSATQVAQVVVNGKGLVTGVTNVTISGTAPGGSAGGDLSGTYPNPTVAKINGVALGTATATAGNLLIGSGTAWVTNTISGDATLSSAGALTLSTVNTNVGTFGSSTAIPSFTVNGKGLITAASTSAVIAPAGTLTGTTLASNVVTSSLTSIGTIGTGVWQGTLISGQYGGTGVANTGLTISLASGGVGKILSSDVSGNASWTLLSSLGVTSITGTASQILANGATTAQTGAVTLTLPSAIVTPGTLSVNGTLRGSSSSTCNAVGPYNLSIRGTQITDTGSNFAQAGILIESVFQSPNNVPFSIGGITNISRYIAASTKTVLLGAAYYAQVNCSGNVGTITKLAHYYSDAFVGVGGTVTNVYGFYGKDPGTGSASVAAYFDNLSVGYSTIDLTGTNNAVFSGNVSIGSSSLTSLFNVGSSNQFQINTSGTIVSGLWNGTKISEIYGGTNQNSYVLGDILYSSATNTLSKLAGNATTTPKALMQTGTGSASAAPAWTAIPTSITGTANQVLANGVTTAQTGAITLSLPQSIDTSATPTFAGETLTGALFTNVGTAAGALTTHWALRTTGGALRIAMGLVGTESGANAGSNFRIFTYTDAGGFGIDALNIIRATGQVGILTNAINNTAIGLQIGNSGSTSFDLALDGAAASEKYILYYSAGGGKFAVGLPASSSTYTIADFGTGNARLQITSTGRVVVGTNAGIGLFANTTANLTIGGIGASSGSFVWQDNTIGYVSQITNASASSTANCLALSTIATDSASYIINAQANGNARLALVANGNIGINGESYGSGTGVVFIANRSAAPSGNPTGGGILYVESGALKYRGSSGTVTTLAAA